MVDDIGGGHMVGRDAVPSFRGAPGGPRRDGSAFGRRAAAGCLVAGAVAYNDWLLQFWVATGLDQGDSYVSEAFAAEQPHRVLFSAVEVGTAVLVVTAACLGVRTRPGSWPLVGWGALAMFGACSLVDVAFPIPCAPSLEAGCPVDSVAHTLTSGLVHFTLFASMAAFVIARRSGSAERVWAGRWACWLLPVSLASAVLSAGPYVGLPGGQGMAQRVHLITVGLWLGLLAVSLRQDITPSTSPDPGAVKGRRTCP